MREIIKVASVLYDAMKLNMVSRLEHLCAVWFRHFSLFQLNHEALIPQYFLIGRL